MRRKAIGGEEAITCRPADLIEPEYETMKEEVGDLARTEEDVLTYALFPAIARDYLKKKYAAA